MITTGQTTFTTTAAQLSDAVEKPVTRVTVKALAANANNLFVVSSAGGTAAKGYPLDAGEEVTVEVQKLGDVFIIADAAGQVAAWIATNRPVDQSSPDA